MRRRLLKGPALFPLLLAATSLCATEAHELPNIVVILADDLGYGDLGSYGCDDIRTPNLDRLAREGVRLTQFYSNGPECSPTRTAFLTGRYQQRVGGLECAIGLGTIGRYPQALSLSERGRLGLPVEFSALPRMPAAAGYHTALVGKWHLGDGEAFRPGAHGFDYSIGPLGGAIDYFYHTEPRGVFIGTFMEGEPDFFRQGREHDRTGYYATDLFSDEAVAWINIQKPDRPFFLYLAYTAPHTPYQGPNDFDETPITTEEWNKGDRATYAAMVEAMDAGVGRVLAKLDHAGIAEQTLVVFFSDNGPAGLGSTGGLRGAKGGTFEGGIRVPCLIRWPGKIPSGSVSGQVALSMDLTASIGRIVGGTPPRPFDGIDIIRHIEEGKPDFPRTVFWRGIRGDAIKRAVRDGDLKFVRNTDSGRVEEFLFDLAQDPSESHDLAAARPGDRARLRQLLADWERTTFPERSDL